MSSHPAARRVVLVTGAARRIGRAIALALAQHGWDVVVHYRSSADDAHETVARIEAAGQRAVAIGCDLADE
ncbi:MAG TPA: SDR family NAD(P)-dependent oxidoreductase, partial [Oxalicibacterium sp.]|nr:SDR family NAD(P)-dependent oxidoreductase [Oxalicibacterium sp.]